MKRRWRSSAAWRFSDGRSRGSWMESAAAITITSRTQPFLSASSTIRASLGSTGSWASWRPSGVRRLRWSFSAGSRAPSSWSRLTPSLMLRESGGSRNGKAAMSPSPAAVICRMTEARLVRRISASVNSGRERKSSSEYSRMAMPSEVRPQDVYKRQYLMPGTVSEVSATLVASTIRRLFERWNTRCCSAELRRA